MESIQEQLNKLQKDYQKIVEGLSNKTKKEKYLNEVFLDLKKRLDEFNKSETDEISQAVIKLKLARYLQHIDRIDVNTLFDAIIETPEFISSDRGSFTRLFEVHEQKTLQKIAEIRREKSERAGQGDQNPFEKILTTDTGKYYVAKLLNMQHLAEESEFMSHCVGLSDSYINRMKRGEIEILSFRDAQTNMPVVTIEYDVKNKIIVQLARENNYSLTLRDAFFLDLLGALKQLKQTKDEKGEFRDIKKIIGLFGIPVPEYNILTEKGIIPLSEYHSDLSVFKTGQIDITPELTIIDLGKILYIRYGIKCEPEEIARKPEEITSKTKFYLGEMFPGVFDKNFDRIFDQQGLEVRVFDLEVGGKSGEELKNELLEKNIYLSSYTLGILSGPGFALRDTSIVRLVRLTVNFLGFNNTTTTEELCSRAQAAGLTVCDPFVGPYLRLQDLSQPYKDSYFVVMEKKSDNPNQPGMFIQHEYVNNEPMLSMEAYMADPQGVWSTQSEFIFTLTGTKH